MSLAVRRYSEALLDIAFEENCEEEVYEQFGALYAEMKTDKDFERLMTEKILSSEELKATVSKILDGGNTYLISFLMTLIDRNRMDEVMDMFGLINTDEFGNKSYSDEGVEFATEILDVINDVKDNFECDCTFNIEMIPAENCAGVICQADNLLYEQDKYFIYSNQWIPLTEQCTIQEKCRLGSLFDAKCGGGCIAHIDIENRFPTKDAAWDMLNYIADQGVTYFAFNTKIQACKHNHAFYGTICPKCGCPVETEYTRIVGFYTPVKTYSKERKAEYKMREWENVSGI